MIGQAEKASALTGLKIVECGEGISTAYCAKQLADFGAEVIKVEKPGAGDETRRMGPFPGDLPDPESSGLFLFLNTNKLGITLNLADTMGREIFRRLCQQADILIVGKMPAEEGELHYQELSQANPRLIVVLVTPFGLTSPYRDYKATELVLMHMSGVAYFTPGEVADLELEPPLKLPGRQAELMAGMTAAVVAMFAIFHRELTGVGQIVDVAARDSAMLTNMWALSVLSYTGSQPSRTAAGRVPMAPAHMLPCQDGYVQVNCIEERQWSQFVEVLGSPEWSQSELFKDRFSRGKHWEALEPLLSAETRKWQKEALSRSAQAEGVPCTVVRSPADLVASAQLAERGFYIQVEHPVAGRVMYPGCPFLMSETPWQHRLAPRLGEHSEQILCHRLGYCREELVAMRRAGVI